jgi:hypothetical protein
LESNHFAVILVILKTEKMAKSIFPVFISTILLLAACDDNITETEFYDSGYPTHYCILSNEKREELFENFNSEFKEYFEVDSFGFINRNRAVKVSSAIFEGKLDNQDSVVAIVKEFVFHNSETTGIEDTGELVVKKVGGYWASYGGKFVQLDDNDRNRWYIEFNEQKYENLTVYGTNLGAYVNPAGVYEIFRHWFPYIYIPEKERIDFIDAKERLVGKTLGYYDWGGSKIWTISTDDFYADDIPKKVIFPFRNDNCIEMRVCWFIASKTIWNFYVDVITGELIFNEQTVYF